MLLNFIIRRLPCSFTNLFNDIYEFTRVRKKVLIVYIINEYINEFMFKSFMNYNIQV